MERVDGGPGRRPKRRRRPKTESAEAEQGQGNHQDALGNDDEHIEGRQHERAPGLAARAVMDGREALQGEGHDEGAGKRHAQRADEAVDTGDRQGGDEDQPGAIAA